MDLASASSGVNLDTDTKVEADGLDDPQRGMGGEYVRGAEDAGVLLDTGAAAESATASR